MQTVFETRRSNETDDERLADRFSRSEAPEQRARRIQARPVDLAQVAALRRLWAA